MRSVSGLPSRQMCVVFKHFSGNIRTPRCNKRVLGPNESMGRDHQGSLSARVQAQCDLDDRALAHTSAYSDI
jgi:hypothetical protein